jgi:8-oxo-dGTP diphosphatase
MKKKQKQRVHREKIQLPIALACVIDRGEVLMIKRNEPSLPEIHGKWEFPGGKVEFGEAPEQTAVREVFEETGVSVTAGPMLPFTYVAVRESSHKRLNALVLCIRCGLIGRSAPPVLPAKVSEVAWIPLPQVDPLKVQSGTFQFLHYELQREGAAPALCVGSPSVSYLSLRSIDHTANRMRGYSVTIESDLAAINPFRVHLSWGRLPYQSRNCVDEFKNRDSALEHVKAVLTTRKRHGYVLVRKSDNFPDLPVLTNFPAESNDPQGRLFQCP